MLSIDIFRPVLIVILLSSFVLSLPLPARTSQYGGGKQGEIKIKYKRPPPGVSDVYYKKKAKVIRVAYGDDIPEHQQHLVDWREGVRKPHPKLLGPLYMASKGSTTNRKNALRGIPTMKGKHRDEKMPNCLKNPWHCTTTTVRYVPDTEGFIEGGLLSKLRRVHTSVQRKYGVNARVHLYANPKFGGRDSRSSSKTGQWSDRSGSGSSGSSGSSGGSSGSRSRSPPRGRSTKRSTQGKLPVCRSSRIADGKKTQTRQHVVGQRWGSRSASKKIAKRVARPHKSVRKSDTVGRHLAGGRKGAKSAHKTSPERQHAVGRRWASKGASSKIPKRVTWPGKSQAAKRGKTAGHHVTGGRKAGHHVTGGRKAVKSVIKTSPRTRKHVVGRRWASKGASSKVIQRGPHRAARTGKNVGRHTAAQRKVTKSTIKTSPARAQKPAPKVKRPPNVARKPVRVAGKKVAQHVVAPRKPVRVARKAVAKPAASRKGKK